MGRSADLTIKRLIRDGLSYGTAEKSRTAERLALRLQRVVHVTRDTQAT